MAGRAQWISMGQRSRSDSRSNASPADATEPLPVVSMHAMYTVNGVEVDGFLTRPVQSGGAWPGIVVGHSYRGVTQFYREWSRRLAAEGFVVLVPDFYEGRLAADAEEASRLKVSMDFDVVAHQLAAAADFLRSLPYVRSGVGITGHCLGGGLALMALARSSSFDCGVIYYHSVFPDESELQQIRTPLLAHFGTADPFTPVPEGQKLERLVRESGTPIQVEWYEGMSHAFANQADATPAQREAADRAWTRTIAFFREHMSGTDTAEPQVATTALETHESHEPEAVP